MYGRLLDFLLSWYPFSMFALGIIVFCLCIGELWLIFMALTLYAGVAPGTARLVVYIPFAMMVIGGEVCFEIMLWRMKWSRTPG